MRPHSYALLCLTASVVVLAGCGRTALSPNPRGPTTSVDGGVDGGACTADVQCDDGLVCNGRETCIGGSCASGPPPVCEDGIECTVDRCEEVAGGCATVADNSRCPPGSICDPSAGGCVVRPCSGDDECSDGVFCNGDETCVGGACAGGLPPSCGVGDPCVTALCDFALDECVETPIDRDRDGHIPRECGGNDCADKDPTVNPDAAERCSNGVDDNCNGPTDCEDFMCAGDPSCGCTRFEVSCTDLRDNDCDGRLDCADTDCTGDPSCTCTSIETCDNGRDDDCDGAPDCADPDCRTHPRCMTTCETRDLMRVVGMRVATGSTRGRPNVVTPSCGSSMAGEQAFRWTAPRSGLFTIDTFGSSYDTVLTVLSSCPGPELPGACDDDTGGVQSQVTIRVTLGQTVVIVVDGFSSNEGDYVLNIREGGAPEDCFDGVDNDGDGLVDCADPDCSTSPSCCMPSPEVCGNGADDDCDTLIDCADFDCRTSPACCVPRPEFCGNGIDDDCDTRIDCFDFDCRTSPACCVPRMEDCTNGADDDCDTLTDCADFDCRTAPSCCVPRPEDCANGADDDCDTRIDCLDFDCRTAPSCCVPRPEDCDNFVDDDCDTRRDCADPDCSADPACCVPRPEDCGNMRDDDCDRLTDCADPSCSTSPLCCIPSPEVCNNSRDDDCDRLVDCADSSCVTSPACCVPVPEVCDDGMDQDCDTLVDCADSDCRAAPACCVPRPEVCDNFADDDCDRRVDCGDTDCTTSPACCVASPEICDDGMDQDCDMQIDCADMDCAAAPACRPCPDRDLGTRLGLVATGSTVGQFNDVTPTCSTSNAPDVTYRWTAPFAGDFIIDTNGSSYDTMLAILDGCGGPQLACDDDSGTGTQSQIRMRMRAGQSIVIAVDGWGMSSGAYTLNISGLIGGESNCADAVDNDFDGDVDCADSDCAGDPSCPPGP